MTWPIEKKVIIAFSISVTILIIFGILSYWNTLEDDRIDRAVILAQQQLKEVNDVTVRLQEAQVGVRGYVLTGGKSYLEPYNTAKALIGKEMEDVHKILPDTQAQRKRFNLLNNLLKERFSLLEETVKLRNEKGFTTALNSIRDVRRNRLTDDIVKLITDMENDDLALINHLSAQADKSAERVKLIVPLGSLLAVFLGLMSILAINRDIVALKQTKAHIQRLNKDLEQLVSELKDANKELDTFNYSVSHDLRQPLTSISGYVQLISINCVTRLDAESKDFLEIIQRKIDYMAQLINDLLSFSRSGRQEVKKVEIDMKKLSGGIMDDLRAAVPERNIEYKTEGVPYAWGDYGLIKEVLINLFSNAVKYTKTRQAGAIHFSGRTEGNENIFCIRDNGIGFDTKDKDRLFDVFQRLPNSEGFEGTGVGLAIVQRIVLRHSGRVWAESRPDQGATFCFSLPGKDAA